MTFFIQEQKKKYNKILLILEIKKKIKSYFNEINIFDKKICNPRQKSQK